MQQLIAPAMFTRAQIRPTAAGAHLAPVTDPQHMALHIAATVGRVQRGGQPGQLPVRVLTALARKGYLTLTAHPGPRRSNWAYGQITPAGRRELARLNTDAGQTGGEPPTTEPARASVTSQVDPFALCHDRNTSVFDQIDRTLAVAR